LWQVSNYNWGRKVSCYFGSMFDTFSERARRIVFAARVKAGERGADMIDVDDFLVGLVLEDQGLLTELMAHFLGEPVTFFKRAEAHTPFFPPKTAQDLLSSLDKLLPQLKPLSRNKHVPLSPSLGRVLHSAKALQSQFRHSQVEPLHLLAAILAEESSEGVRLLQGSGITREKVLRALGGSAEN